MCHMIIITTVVLVRCGRVAKLLVVGHKNISGLLRRSYPRVTNCYEAMDESIALQVRM
jgi:hypothetical protein